jgi:hypothetical protein
MLGVVRTSRWASRCSHRRHRLGTTPADHHTSQGLPREWGLTGKWEDGPTYEQIQAIDAKYKPALDAWVDSLGLRQAKKYLDSVDMKLT